MLSKKKSKKTKKNEVKKPVRRYEPSTAVNTNDDDNGIFNSVISVIETVSTWSDSSSTDTSTPSFDPGGGDSGGGGSDGSW
jgi:uncharacterized membrane protein YgcG